MHIVLVTRPDYFSEEASLVNALFEQGVSRIHVRKENSSSAALGKLLSSVDGLYHRRLVWHGHPEDISGSSIGGIHLKESMRINYTTEKLQELRNDLAGMQMSLSSSFHNPEDIPPYQTCFDYVFLGPVFESISKPGYKAHKGIRPLRGLRCRQYAIGGIRRENLEEIAERGFDGAVILGAVWMSSDPVKSFNEIMQEVLSTQFKLPETR